MLVLRAAVGGEPICVGHDVMVIVTAVKGSTVRLGFIAPPEVPIDRLSVRRSKERDTAAAARPAATVST